MLYVFIHGLTGRIFKALPLREAYESGEDVGWKEYFHSLTIDATGALSTFPELQQMQSYLTIVNTLQYMDTESFKLAEFRREIFSMLRALNNIEARFSGKGGEADV